MKSIKKFTPWGVATLGLVVLLTIGYAPEIGAQIEDITNFNGVHLTNSTFGTATPALMVQNGGSGMSLELRNGSATPVYQISGAGASTYSGGQTFNNFVSITAPTSVATAVPALKVDSSGGLSRLFEVRDSATPVFYVNDGGTWASTGAGTHSDGQTINDWARVAAPTDIATATPAAVIDSAGVSVLLEVRDAATPVARFPNGGGLDMLAGAISNIGAAGTDFSATGGLTLADDLDMSAQPITNVGNAGTDFSTAGGLTTASTITVTAGGLVISAGGANITGNATFSAFQLSTSQSITPTDGAAITPTAGIVILTAAAEVTPTIAACTGGEHLILYGGNNQSINLADADNFVLTGALVLTQYDTLPLVCISTKWVQAGPVSAN